MLINMGPLQVHVDVGHFNLDSRETVPSL